MCIFTTSSLGFNTTCFPEDTATEIRHMTFTQTYNGCQTDTTKIPLNK